MAPTGFGPDKGQHAAEPGIERPVISQDVADALAEAVRKAREATGGGAARPGRRQGRRTPGDPPYGDTVRLPGVRGTAQAELAPAAWQSSSRRRRDGSSKPPRWLVRGVVGAAILALLLGAADIGLSMSNHRASPPAGPGSTPATIGGQGTTTTTAPRASTTTQPQTATTQVPTSTTQSSTTTIPAGTTTSPSTTVAPGGPPRLTSVAPATGEAGTVVTVYGSNFYSPQTGVVLAHLDGQAAKTDCPTQDSCQVTVPQLGHHPASVTLTITTDSGTSNPLAFRYR